MNTKDEQEHAMETEITLKDFKLIKSFYLDFHRKEGIRSNSFIVDWSGIMPVIAKFRDLHFEGKQQREHRVFIDKLRTAMYWTRIDTAYYELSKAIKWYRSQPEGNTVNMK